MREDSERGCSRRGLIAPLVLILLGSVFLLQNTGLLPRYIAQQWWPVLLLVVGVAMLLRRSMRRR